MGGRARHSVRAAIGIKPAKVSPATIFHSRLVYSTLLTPRNLENPRNNTFYTMKPPPRTPETMEPFPGFHHCLLLPSMGRLPRFLIALCAHEPVPIQRYHIVNLREQRLPLPGGEGRGEGGLPHASGPTSGSWAEGLVVIPRAASRPFLPVSAPAGVQPEH